MYGRGDPALAASPLGSRRASFADRRHMPVLGTEVLQPQKAWEFTTESAAEGDSSDGNLASHMRPQVGALGNLGSARMSVSASVVEHRGLMFCSQQHLALTVVAAPGYTDSERQHCCRPRRAGDNHRGGRGFGSQRGGAGGGRGPHF